MSHARHTQATGGVVNILLHEGTVDDVIVTLNPQGTQWTVKVQENPEVWMAEDEPESHTIGPWGIKYLLREFEADTITMEEMRERIEKATEPEWPALWTPDGPPGETLEGFDPETIWTVDAAMREQIGWRGKAITLDSARRTRQSREQDVPYLGSETEHPAVKTTLKALHVNAAKRGTDGRLAWSTARKALEEAGSPHCLRCDALELVMTISENVSESDTERQVVWPIDRAYVANGDDIGIVQILIRNGEPEAEIDTIIEDLSRGWKSVLQPGDHQAELVAIQSVKGEDAAEAYRIGLAVRRTLIGRRIESERAWEIKVDSENAPVATVEVTTEEGVTVKVAPTSP